ncbi:MAG: histidine kinase, partial [Bacteriovoracaceae bacterium]|nr:histidine kinase [Bacteriovoracaceae bacterium]
EKILDQKQMVPIIAKQIVHEHHERVNGKGYPRGIKNLNVSSRIVAIADCFNSLTSERTYEKAIPPFEALKLMITTMKKEFDTTLLERFIQMLSKN